VSLPVAEPPRLNPRMRGAAPEAGCCTSLPCLFSSIFARPAIIRLRIVELLSNFSWSFTDGEKYLLSFVPEPSALLSMSLSVLLVTVSFASAFGILPAPGPNSSSKADFASLGEKSNRLCASDVFASFLTFPVTPDIKPSKAFPAMVEGCIFVFMLFLRLSGLALKATAIFCVRAPIASLIILSVKLSKFSFTDFTKVFSTPASRYLTLGVPETFDA